MLNDSHAHMDMLDEKELSEALKKAKEVGVGKIVSCATSFPSNTKTLALAAKFPQIKAAIGLYPLDAAELTQLEIDKAFYFFNAEIQKPEVVAVGEVGLDFKYSEKESEQEKQKKVFERFIGLANEHEKPLIIHSRFAQRQVIEMLEKYKAEKALLHSFVDSLKLMKRAAEAGHFVSVGLSVLYNEEVQKNITAFPLESLLFETDSPIRFNGEKTGPEKVTLVAQKVTQLKGLTLKEVEAQQEKNFKKLFVKKT